MHFSFRKIVLVLVVIGVSLQFLVTHGYVTVPKPFITLEHAVRELHPLAPLISLGNALHVPNLFSHGAPLTPLLRSEIIAETNVARKDNGLPALTENTKLDASADVKVADMFAKQYFEHTSPDGKSVGNLATSQGYAYSVIGENLALGAFANSQAVVDAWLASPEHKANMLNTKYTDIGIGVAQGSYNGETVWLAVQHFGRPLSLCPTIDQVLKKSIDTDEAEIARLQADLQKRKGEIESMQESDPNYNTDVETYNAEIQTYNTLLGKAQVEVAKYNVEVKNFNACLQS